MQEYTQPSIWIGNIRIDEPITTLTDLLVTGVCMYAFFKIQGTPVRNKTRLLLMYYFLTMGLATAMGGILGHAFLYRLTFSWKLPGWLMSMFSIALLERASIMIAKPLIKPAIGNFFAILNLVELATFITLAFSTLNFFFVEAHSAYGLLIVVFGFQGYVYLHTRSMGSRLFLIAVGISAGSALIFMNKWGIHAYLNHYDISHIMMAVSAYFFYKGSVSTLKANTIT